MSEREELEQEVKRLRIVKQKVIVIIDHIFKVGSLDGFDLSLIDEIGYMLKEKNDG